ncbi:MAG: hypothetical protein HPY57_13595 [Ignavibacteria bacterium]|nr:hypothetical protein [Ignavibacteria bacterium]
MLHNYKSFIILNESKSRDKKLEKQREKIYKFLKFDPIIDYVFDKVVDKDSTRGLKYTIWFCDRISKMFINYLKSQNITIFAGITIPKSKYEEFLKTGKFNLQYDKEEAKKAGLADNLEEAIKLRIYQAWRWNQNSYDRYVSVISDWLKSPIREEKINLSDYKTLTEAYDKAHEWHNNLKASGIVSNETGTILMTFDDGYYWIDLETDSSRDEADAMGHCGTTNYGKTLYSLRKKQSPHVTAAIGNIDYNGPYNTVYQMKGRNNKKPIEKYYKYIFELLSYPNVSENVKIETEFDKIIKFSTIEYMPGEDFHVSDLSLEQIIQLQKRNPELISNLGLPIKYKLYKSGHISKVELTKDYNDLKVVDDEIHFVVPDWTSFDKSIFNTDRDHRTGWQIEVLEGTSCFYFYNDLDFDYTYTYDKIKPYVFNDIINIIDKKGDCVMVYNIEDGDSNELILSKQNMEYSEKEKDILIKTPEGVFIKFVDLLDDGSKRNWLKNKKNVTAYCDELDGLKEILDRSYSMAQSLADEDEARDAVINAIQNKIGPLVKKDEKNWWFEDGLHFKLNFEYVIDIINASGDDLQDSHSIIDIINSIPSDNEDLLIDVKVPYYGWNGIIDSDTLSEEIINRLDEF